MFVELIIHVIICVITFAIGVFIDLLKENDMDEYIIGDNMISAVCLGCNQQFSAEPCEPSECTIRQSILALPSADVVPKSEIKKLIEEIETALKKSKQIDMSNGPYFEIYLEVYVAEIKKKYLEKRYANTTCCARR